MNAGRLAALVGCAVLGVQAAAVPPPGAVDARVREIEYRDGEVVSLAGYVGYHIDIELEPDERLVALGAGDAGGLEVAADGPHVFLKPKAADVATNLTLVTSRRVYYFDYRTYEAQPPARAAVFALRFRYPAVDAKSAPVATPRAFESGGAATTAPAVAAPAAEAPVVVPRAVNRDYWYCGSPWLQPAAAEDDGVQTRLRFGSRAEWPAIFVAEADGTETLANFHVEGTTAVMHRVAARWVLRRGGLVGCVENRGYAGSGAYVPDGTQVASAVRTVQP